MRKITEHGKKLRELYNSKNDKLQGLGEWKKFPLFWFLLFMSYKCTRRCEYCYTLNQVDNNQIEMNEETFSRLLDWMPEVYNQNNVKVQVIVFLGGEPLLRTDRIKKVMDTMKNKTLGIQGNLYSNYDLIDSVNWDDLEDIQWYQINITNISIEEIQRRMKIAEERSNAINQTIVATLDDFNISRIIEVSKFGLENGYRLRYYRNLFRGTDVEYKVRLLKKYHEICDVLEDYAVKGYDVHTTFLFDTLIPKWDFDSSPYHCGKRIATVYPDGSVGPCLRNHTFKTGNIWNENPISLIQKEDFIMDLRRPDLPDECKSCDVKLTCQGGCPNDRLLNTGSMKGKSLFCDVHKEIIPRLRYIDEINERKIK